MPQRAVKFVKPAKSQRQYLEFNKVTLFDGMMEQWNGGISFNSECLVVRNGISMKEEIDLQLISKIKRSIV